MIPVRVIPCLLIERRRLVKTVKFANPKYVGDPINAVKIFNDKEADELLFVDISATPSETEPPFDLLAEISSECFMPFAYGGGVRTMGHFARLFALGVEKVCVNSHAALEPGFLAAAARDFGSQSVVAAIDVKRRLFGGCEARIASGRRGTGMSPVDLARRYESEGAGEILLNDVDRDGTMSGYNTQLIRDVSRAVRIPLIALGGAGSVADLADAIRHGASAAAAGSLFVYMGQHRAVLINYPNPAELRIVASAAGPGIKT